MKRIGAVIGLIAISLGLFAQDNLLEVWPNLEVFFHGGTSFAPYRSQFRDFIKSDRMQYMETYNASEGFFGLQDDPNSNDMLLMLDLGIFYEFIPADMTGEENTPVYTIGEVKENVISSVIP